MSVRLLVVLAAAHLAGCARARPDVVLLTVDTLRTDHVGAFSNDSPARTPNMDALARDGVAYTQAWSPISVTGPAFATLLTGQEPGTHGVVLNHFRGGPSLPDAATTLAEALRQDGYATAAFVSGFTLRPELGLSQGFDTYEYPGAVNHRRTGALSTHLALRWLDARPTDTPVFLWVHLYDTHGPLTAERRPIATERLERDPDRVLHVPTYQRIEGISDPAFYAARYASAVEHGDAQVGKVIERLRATGRYERALVVLVADHGETLVEREPWMDHGTHASAEQLHVPLVVKYPGGRDAGTRIDSPLGLADVAPTLLESLGLPPLPAADGRPGGAGRDTLLGESSHCKDEAFLDCAPPGVEGKEFALRTSTRAFVRRGTDAGVVYDVYDRVSDPGERSPIPEDPPADVRARLDALAADRASRGISLPGGSDTDERAALKALGYAE